MEFAEILRLTPLFPCGNNPVNWTDPSGLVDTGSRLLIRPNEPSTPNFYGGEPVEGEWGNWEFPTYGGEGITDRVGVGGPGIGPGGDRPAGQGDYSPNDRGISGNGGRDGGSGTRPGGRGSGNPYRGSGVFIAEMSQGFQAYNLQAHAAFWEEYAQWVPSFIPGMAAAGRIGSGLRPVARTVTKEIVTRANPGRDGGISKHIIERVNGRTNSVTHQVHVNGRLIHQHQTHIGKYNGRRRFPDEWVEYPTIP
jgi:hypothetical protein